MGHEISIQDSASADSRACARGDTTDLCVTRCSDRARGDIAGPHPHVAIGASRIGASESGAIHQRAVVADAADGIPGIGEAVLGATFVGARVLLRDGGCGG